MNLRQKRQIHQGIYVFAMLTVGALGSLDLWLIQSLLADTAPFLRPMVLVLGGGFILACLALVHYLHRRHQRLVERNHMLQTEKQSLEQLNRAKSEFLSMMSHEFRTPLNAILGFAEALESQTRGELNATQLRYVHNIRKSGEYLLALINNVLDLSRIELGKLKLRWGVLDLKELIQEVAQILQPQAEEKGLTFRWCTQGETPLVHGDPTRLRQVVYNLVHNAIKFTPSGGHISLDARVTPHQTIIQVRDTGIGIASDDQEKVFAMFQQVDSSHTRDQQGTGLGLALCKQLVALHGGTIDLESELNKGSTFTVRLPRFGPHQMRAQLQQAREITVEAAE